MKKTAIAALLSFPLLFSCSSPSGPSSSPFGASLPFGEKLYGENFVGALVCGDSYGRGVLFRNYQFGDQYIILNGDGTGVEVADYTYEEWTLDYDADAYVFEADQVISWARDFAWDYLDESPILVTYVSNYDGEYQNESYDSLSQYVYLYFDGGVAQVSPTGGYFWYLSADEVKTLYGKDVQ